MISDFVKGKKQYDYPDAVQKGIRLHRAIDTFTDAHPATQEGKQYFKPAVGTYAGAFMDVVYDHFLASDETLFTDISLRNFAEEVYLQLHEQQHLLHENFARMLPYMSSQNWLYGYRFTPGIEKSFGGVVRRAKYLTEYAPAYALFLAHYESLKKYYDAFIPDIRAFASSQFEDLLKQ